MSVKIDGLDKVSRKLGGLANFSQWAYRPMTESAEVVRDAIAKYPQKDSGAFSRLATADQKKAYWAKVRSGEARHREGVGYVRSGTLGRKWVVEVKNTTNGVQGTVGNNTSYGRYVQAMSSQQPFHKASGWTTEQQAIDKSADQINNIWSNAINRELSR
jgi:hypothetical protein